MNIIKTEGLNCYISRPAEFLSGPKDKIVLAAIRRAGVIPSESNLRKISYVVTPCGTENYYYDLGGQHERKIVALTPCPADSDTYYIHEETVLSKDFVLLPPAPAIYPKDSSEI